MNGPVHLMGTGSHWLGRVSNQELSRYSGLSGKLVSRWLGVESRALSIDLDTGRVLPGGLPSELGAEAGRKALAMAGIDPEEVDLLMVGTSSGDYSLPGTAPFVADLLGMGDVALMDFRGACNTTNVLLSAGGNALRSGSAQVVLAVGTEVGSPRNWTASFGDTVEEKMNASMFGDGAGAFVLGTGPGPEVLATALGYRGRGRAPGLWQPMGGAVEPLTPDGVQAGRHRYHHNYQMVAEGSEELFRAACDRALQGAGMTLPEVSHVVVHQATGYSSPRVARALGLPPERVPNTGRFLGNTGAASAAVTLDHLMREGGVSPGDTILVVTGEGSKWYYGGTVIRA